MSIEDKGSRIKNYNNFVNPKIYRLFNFVIFKEKSKGTLFSKPKEFEIKVYYSPFKKIIIDVVLPDNYNYSKLPFKIGDNIDLVYKYIQDNKFEIIHKKEH